MEMRNTIDLMLESNGASVSGNGSLKLNKSGKPKKISDRKGKPTANGDFIKKIRAEHFEELKAFQETAEKKQGAHLVFVSNYKKAHEEEYKAFIAAWTPNKDDSETASTLSAESSSVASLSATLATLASTSAAARPPTIPSRSVASSLDADIMLKSKVNTINATVPSAMKVAAPIAPPAAPTASAKKPVKKAQKAVITAMAQPIASSSDEELLPFTMAGKTYVRTGYQRPDGNHLWISSYLWESDKGAKGAYIGQLQPDGTIDADADEPSN
jgi:hypothetical protein